MEDNGGPITAITKAALSPFEDLARRRQNWRMLDEVEKNLRRASQGLTLVIFTLIAAFHCYSLRELGSLFVDLWTDPRKAWPAAVMVCLLAYGLARGIAGVRRLAGFRDGIRVGHALIRLAIGLSVVVYLWLNAWPWEEVKDWMWGLGTLGLTFVMAAGVWTIFIGAFRIVVLSLPRASARVMVDGQIKEQEFSWDDAPRPWWQLWRRRP